MGLAKHGFALLLGAFLVVTIQVLVHAHDEADELRRQLEFCDIPKGEPF